jgi:hypothetical protein
MITRDASVSIRRSMLDPLATPATARAVCRAVHLMPGRNRHRVGASER